MTETVRENLDEMFSASHADVQVCVHELRSRPSIVEFDDKGKRLAVVARAVAHTPDGTPFIVDMVMSRPAFADMLDNFEASRITLEILESLTDDPALAGNVVVDKFRELLGNQPVPEPRQETDR